jgi:type IV pilus assembly protein PilA
MHIRSKASPPSGFTLIELMVVVAILGILAAVAIPAFMKNARKAKTSEAITNVKKLYDGARSYYEEEHSNPGGLPLPKQYPDSIAALVDSGSADGGADPELASGSAGGYDFVYTVSADHQSFTLVAQPTVPGVTGEAIVSTDQTGDITLDEDPAVARVDAALRDRAVAAVEDLDRMTGGAARGAAEAYLGEPGQVEAVWAALVLDPASGGTLRDLLDRVPAATTGLMPAATGWDEGGDPAAPQAALGGYLDEVRIVAEAILDDPVGAVDPPADLQAEALALIAEARPVTASEAVGYLSALEAHLDPADDMTMKNPTANDAHRSTLVRAAARIERAIARGQATPARRGLHWTRRFTDGDAPDWIAAPAADRIRLQVDLSLRLAARLR